MRNGKPRDGTERDRRLTQCNLTSKGKYITRLFLEIIRQLDGEESGR